MKFTFAVAAILSTSAFGESAYPDLDNFDYVNYAEPQQVVYDYVEDYGNTYTENSDRYQVGEKQAQDYDYNSRDYVVVQEGTEGSYTEMGDFHYEPRGGSRRDRDSYGSYYRDNEPRVEHHHHHYNGSDYRRSNETKGEGKNHGGNLYLFLSIFMFTVAGVCYYKLQQEQARQKRVEENAGKVTTLTVAPSSQLPTSEPVYFQGQCIVDGPVTDPLFGIVTREHPLLVRKVETFCWIERKEDVQERHGDAVRRGTKYHYKAAWQASVPDSRNFKDPKYNQNVQPGVQSERITGGSQVRVGTYYSVELGDLEKAFGLTRLPNMYKHAPVTAQFDRQGIWQHDSKGGYLTRQKNPGKDTVGDVRVSYQVLNNFDDISTKEVWATVVGVPQASSMARWSALSSTLMSGKCTLTTFLMAKTV